jgi:hypothetical protein
MKHLDQDTYDILVEAAKELIDMVESGMDCDLCRMEVAEHAEDCLIVELKLVLDELAQ